MSNIVATIAAVTVTAVLGTAGYQTVTAYQDAQAGPQAPRVTLTTPQPVEPASSPTAAPVRSAEAQAALDAYTAAGQPTEQELVAASTPADLPVPTTILGAGFGTFDADYTRYVQAGWNRGLLTAAAAEAAVDVFAGRFHTGQSYRSLAGGQGAEALTLSQRIATAQAGYALAGGEVITASHVVADDMSIEVGVSGAVGVPAGTRTVQTVFVVRNYTDEPDRTVHTIHRVTLHVAPADPTVNPAGYTVRLADGYITATNP